MESAMIAICPAAELKVSTPVTTPRTGSLRRIDDILTELLGAYALAAPVTVSDETNRPAETVAHSPVWLPALETGASEMPACCVATTE
jgi:hypothetical protein